MYMPLVLGALYGNFQTNLSAIIKSKEIFLSYNATRGCKLLLNNYQKL